MLQKIVVAALIPTVVACTTFGPVTPHDFIVAHRPAQVWVSHPDGSVVVVERPSFMGDTLTGFVKNKYREIAPDQIRTVKARRAAPARTVLLVVGGTGAVIAAAVMVNGTGACTPVVGPSGSGGGGGNGGFAQTC